MGDKKQKKKKDLGLGIRALLSSIDTDKTETTTEDVVKELSNTIAMIELEEIEVNPFQPRNEFDEDALQELADSIKVHGLIQPVTVRRLNHNSYQLISGERRLRASRKAGLESIPAYIRIADDHEMMEMALVENIQREQLNAIEVAITYQRLMDEFDLTHDLLSQRVGKNRSTVTNYLRLLKLPPEIQNALISNNISMGHARALVGVEDITIQLTVFNKLINEKLSVRALEDEIRSYSTRSTTKNPKPTAPLPSAYKQVQDDLSSLFGAKVRLKKKGKAGQGQILINFSSDADLNRLLDILEKDS